MNFKFLWSANAYIVFDPDILPLNVQNHLFLARLLVPPLFYYNNWSKLEKNALFFDGKSLCADGQETMLLLPCSF